MIDKARVPRLSAADLRFPADENILMRLAQ